MFFTNGGNNEVDDTIIFFGGSQVKLYRSKNSFLCGVGLALYVVVVCTGAEDVALAMDNQSHIDLVKTYIVQQREDDPLVEIEPGVWVKTSNISGVQVDGTTYYYNLSPHMSFDPVSRGLLKPSMIDVVYKDKDPDVSYIIYKLR